MTGGENGKGQDSAAGSAAGSDPLLIAPLRSILAALRSAGHVRVGVAVSGGADSAMLAVHAAAVAAPLGLALFIYHVHHGLFAEADAWAQRVQALGAALGSSASAAPPVRVLYVHVATDSGAGIEGAARDARYAALADAAHADGVGHILLGHHQDDQAETVLLRLLRGAGPEGLAAMAAASERDGITYLRPWLNVPRARILQAAAAHAANSAWAAVQDPSNVDQRYTRAAVRTLLTPVLDRRWPGWQAIVARHARQAADSAEILAEVAAADLAGLDPSPGMQDFAPPSPGTQDLLHPSPGAQDVSPPSPGARDFSLAAWRLLSPARQAHVLRYWLRLHGARMPSDARLAELLRQLRQLHAMGHDRQLLWEHGAHCVRCVRGRVSIEAREPGDASP
ncbi:tRNA lysidine(34) synthetase TilS [Achromobacter sp. HZ28]|nr:MULTISPECIES: tRNA lysidine(34) synthetase TilS [unclassified Achromobacter]OWT68900.1 tRNA lysidine(34) synthetase TilS [Achromobacter sp. HZ28]OWT78537.1 tRNA lysidine(34) synthetase TilS [Achromobacter sp. HZ34]